jgi:hypothetical protein
VLLSVSLFAAPLSAADDIKALKQQIIHISTQKERILKHNEDVYNQQLAILQAHLLIKTLSRATYLYFQKQGVHRNLQDIEAIFAASYACSWVFPALGNDHLERLANIVQWPRDESGFTPKLISHWKAGTYVESIRKTVLKDTNDYGAYQVNEQHIRTLRNLNKLYDSGVITIRVKHVRNSKDLMDINTNCVARCVIETDRLQRGWEWQHVRDRKFHQMILDEMDKLEKDHFYNRHFVERYYFLTPRKKYNSANFNFWP